VKYESLVGALAFGMSIACGIDLLLAEKLRGEGRGEGPGERLPLETVLKECSVTGDEPEPFHPKNEVSLFCAREMLGREAGMVSSEVVVRCEPDLLSLSEVVDVGPLPFRTGAMVAL
jgi:hypothetical protein